MSNYIPIVISITGVGIAITSLYLSNFRRPDISAGLGPDVHLYHPSDGGTAIYLPVVFTNNSPTRGAVLQAYLKISHPNGKNYYLKWLEEWKISTRQSDYEYISRAKPFTIDGHSSSFKLFWFLRPNDSNPLLFSKGKYQFTLHLWSKHQSSPTKESSETLEVSEIVEEILISRFKNNDPTTRIIHFEGKSLIASETTQDDQDFWSQNDCTP